MPAYDMNDDGKLVDSEGALVLIGEEEVSVNNAQNQPQVDAAIEKRLARQKEHIKTLESQATKTPELQVVIDGLKDDLSRSESALQDAETAAAKKIASQLEEANEKASTFEQALAAEKVGRMRDQVATQILSIGGDFIKPAADLVPILLAVHTQEPVIDETGKPSGEVVDRFKLTFPDPENEGSNKTEKLPLDKAIEVVAALNPHYVKGHGTGGSGGSKYTPGARMITKMSQLKTRDEKIAFVGKHGQEAFMKLTAD